MTTNFILFYMFSGTVLLSAIMVITADNAMYSVLFLILTFCNSTFLLLLLNAEYLALTIILVYIGAVAVLFLFVVMMLDLKQISKYERNLFVSLPISLIIGSVIFIELYFILFYDFVYQLEPLPEKLNYVNWFDKINTISNIEVIGQIMYTYYFGYIIIAGLILLVAMIGSIVLTLNTSFDIKRQQVSEQVSRKVQNSFFLLK